MSLTPSTMLELGTVAPNFSLPTPEGKSFSLSAQTIDKGLLILFVCNHCPYVQHIRPKLVLEIRRYQELGITVAAINSNDFSIYPDDAPARMAETAKEYGFTFPYLVDETQSVAKAYRAACTPDFFLFDKDKKLVYRGQFDGARPGNGKEITGEHLSGAVDLLVAGKPITIEQRPSMGCNIKWRMDNEPDYFGGH